MPLRLLMPALAAAMLATGATGALAQSTVAELLDKGGTRLMKADYDALMPARVQYRWPNGQGEGDLVLTADGKITGTEYHYSSRSDSPATGVWTVADDGKLCTPKEMKAWGRRTDLCWYTFRLGADSFMSASADRDGKLMKIKSIARLP
jgi:hypothetical protein